MGLANLRSYSANKVRSYNQVINYFYEMCYMFDEKWAQVPDYDLNGTGCRNFWNLYKKRAKNQELQNEWNRLFAKASVWKHPRDGSWRLYFNLEKGDKEQVREGFRKEAEEVNKEIQKILSGSVDDFVELDEVFLGVNKETVEKTEQELTEAIEKQELDSKEGGFQFTKEQLNILKNLK